MAKRALKFTKERGTISNRQELRSTLDMWLDTLGNGNYIMAIERVQRPRSNPQNRLMWLWFTIIAQSWSEAVGRTITPEQVHDAYCQIFLPVTMPNGATIAGSTSRLSSEEFTDFLNKVQADAASEYGIRLPTPEEAMYTQYQVYMGYGV